MSAANGPDALGNVHASQVGTTDWPGRSLSTARPEQQGWRLSGENCTIMLSDVVGFAASSRNDVDRRIIRDALFSMTHIVLQDLPEMWSWSTPRYSRRR